MSAKLSRRPVDVFARCGFTTRRIRRNLIKVYESATDQDILEGLTWYDDAHQFAYDLGRATDTDLTTVAAVIAALSPQTRWEANKSAATEMLKNGTRYAGMLISNYERAKHVLNQRPVDALAALQRHGDESAPKIASFARNILGDEQRVTVDVWATRAALGDVPNPEGLLKRVGMYEAIADQYRWIGQRVGVSAPQAQAIVWIALRGSAV